MQAVSSAISNVVALATCQGPSMQILDVVLPTPAASGAALDLSIGSRVPLFGSSIGAAWLSAQTEESVRTVIRLFGRKLAKGFKDVDTILEQARRVKECGYAFGDICAGGGLGGVTMPLPRSPNGTVLVIGAVGPSGEISRRHAQVANSILNVVNECAKWR
jgi:DNA-binding IclR family transcriptional regulator